MKTMMIIGIAIFLVYLTVIVGLNKGPLTSLSDSFYFLEKKQRNLGYVFSAMMMSVAVLILPQMIEVTPDDWRVLGFLPPVCIGFVGAAPCFKKDFESIVHTVAASSAALISLCWVALLTPYWYVILASAAIIVVLGWATKSWKTCYTFWLEMIAFLAVFTTLILLSL